ncbi:hypothetical protein TrLO_g10091 [Triparma laevis f. longispina]|uniref:Protein kinase domain-containing protein n=1 Tax=Triparma laevis f. longispina TaxID=1714387 RepID=A0A9W7FFA4_9STRA|nr:hypothetical protein TrLO_g10091 [Triparma laevis f. longispina]
MSTCLDKIDAIFSDDYVANEGADTLVGCQDEADAELGRIINILWMMICTMLVFFMQVGFALLEVGSVQSKNAKSILIKNLLDGSVGSLAWWAFGYGLAYGPDGNFLCGGSWFFFNDESEDTFRGLPDYAHFLFQWAFATTAATIVSGSIAERCNPTSYLIFSGFITAFFYPIAVHWTWSDQAWLANLGFKDFAGCGPVHIVGGASGLMGAAFLGPRTGRFNLDGQPNPMPAHNLVLSTVGCFILWFGWYGFNGGSVGDLTGGGYAKAAKTMLTTTLSAASAGLSVYWIESFMTGIRDLPPLLNGILAGLVSITASADCVDSWASVIIGVVGAFAYSIGSRAILAYEIDDPLNAFPLHGICGVWGLFAVGLFADDEDHKGLFYAGEGNLGGPGYRQLGVQILGAIVLIIWSTLTSGICFWLVDKCVGLRVTLKEEKLGMDMAHHGGSAYPDFVKKRGAPIQDVVIVMTDIEAPRELWKADPALMVHCQTLHDTIMRTCIMDHSGYEVSAEGDCFTVAFHNAEDAINWGFQVQSQLLQTTWPAELLQHLRCSVILAKDHTTNINTNAAPSGLALGSLASAPISPQKSSKKGRRSTKKKKRKTGMAQTTAQAAKNIGAKKGSRPLFNGLRVRMAMDYGHCDHSVNEITEKYSYSGPPMTHCKAILKSIQSGGQIVITKAMNKALLEGDDPFQDSHKICLGTHIFQDLDDPVELIQCLPQDMAEREILPLVTVRKTGPDYFDAPSANVAPGMPIPPVTIVCTKLADNSLRGVRASMANRVMYLHDTVLRKFLLQNEGYECQGQNGSFILAFPTPEKASNWAIATHLSFLKVDWAKEPKQVADCMAQMKINIGIHSDICENIEPHPQNGRADYFGSIIDVAGCCSSTGIMGQVALSERAYMMLSPGRARTVTVGPTVKIGRQQSGVSDFGQAHGSVQTYVLAVPMSKNCKVEEYKETKWKPFSIPSMEEDKVRDMRLKIEREGKKVGGLNLDKFKLGGGKKTLSAVRDDGSSDSAGQGGALDILETSNLGAWKLDSDEIDFEGGFYVSSGSFGEVKTAMFRGTMVAVKTLKPEQADEENIGRFKEELLLCRDLRHPNIMQVLGGCWSTQEKIYLVMEFCEKGSMGALLKREGSQHRMVTTKLTWAIEMAKAMCYLHGFNPSIVHRDLKGDNVLINHGMSVKVCDFGESRQKSNEGTMTTVGSPFWIAPEVFIGERYDESCDVYSYGLVLLELLMNGQMEQAFNFGLKKHQKRFGLSIAHKIAKGWRPQLDPELVTKYPNYCQLIGDCWQQSSSARPKFSAILNYLLRLQRNVSIPNDCELLMRPEDLNSSDSSSSGTGSADSTITTFSDGSGSTSNSAVSTPSGTIQGGSFRGKPSMPSLREDALYSGSGHHEEMHGISSQSESESESGSTGTGSDVTGSQDGSSSYRSNNSGASSFRNAESPRIEPRGTFNGSDLEIERRNSGSPVQLVQGSSNNNSQAMSGGGTLRGSGGGNTLRGQPKEGGTIRGKTEKTEDGSDNLEMVSSMKSSDRALGVVMKEIMHL